MFSCNPFFLLWTKWICAIFGFWVVLPFLSLTCRHSSLFSSSAKILSSTLSFAPKSNSFLFCAFEIVWELIKLRIQLAWIIIKIKQVLLHGLRRSSDFPINQILSIDTFCDKIILWWFVWLLNSDLIVL